MKRTYSLVLSISVSILLYAPIIVMPAMAQTMYITDVSQVMFRAGKGTDYKILQMLSSGTRVTLIQQEGEWSMVDMDNGQRGWVLTRYLMEGPPKSVVIEQLTQQMAAQKSRMDTLSEENAVLKKSTNELRRQVESLTNDRDAARRSYEELQSGASEYLEVKRQYESLKAEHEHLSRQHQSVQKENENLRDKTHLYWFLSGSSVLLIGIFLGIYVGRLQRKKKHVYS